MKMDFIHSTEPPELIPVDSTIGRGIDIFGKLFDIDESAGWPRFLRHSDYTNICKEDVCNFMEYARSSEKIVITGTESVVHPYRLKYVDLNGFEREFVKVDKKVRGDRHLYNKVYSFRPAMVWIPAGMSIKEFLQNPQKLSCYLLREEKLFDRSNLLDRLLIRENIH